MKKLTDNFPTPYGVKVAVYEDPQGRELYHFEAESAAIFAGIYDPAQRRRFVQDAAKAGRAPVDQLADYGGHTVPKVPLPEPAKFIFPSIVKNVGGYNQVVENWVNLAMDNSHWDQRADALSFAIAGNHNRNAKWSVDPELGAVMISHLLTGALEHLGEKTIECLEAAAFYAVTMHPEWREAGLAWLTPFRNTWFQDWIDKHPTYQRLALDMRGATDGALPEWIGGAK